MQSKAQFLNSFSVVVLLLLAPRLVFAQTPAKDQTSPPVATPQETQTSANNGLPAVFGIQGVLIETLDGKLVSEQAADQGFNPASSIKLATALVALRTFGPNYRFTTGFWTDGSFDKASWHDPGKPLCDWSRSIVSL